MSLYDYKVSQELDTGEVSFYGLIMAAMRRADTRNLLQLQYAWPEVWAELEARYNAPGGRLEADQ